MILLSQYIACILGMMLFHLQHHVNTGYWEFIDENDTYKKDLSMTNFKMLYVFC